MQDLGKIDSVAEQDADLPEEDSVESPSIPVVLSNKERALVFITGFFSKSAKTQTPDFSASLASHKDHYAKQVLLHQVNYLQLQSGFALRLYRLVRLWLAFVIAAVFMQGTGWCLWWPFELADKVLITFITSTTASVLGLFILVAKWLFESKAKKESASRKPRATKTQGA